MCCGDHRPQEPAHPSFKAPREQFCLRLTFALYDIFFLIRKHMRGGKEGEKGQLTQPASYKETILI